MATQKDAVQGLWKKFLKTRNDEYRNALVEHYAPLFRVTACPPESTKLFTDPVWYFPGYFDPFRLFVDIA